MKLARPIDKTHLQLSQISKSFLREGHPLPVLADRVYVLSTRPAHVKAVIDVKLPRLRTPTESEFVRLKAELLAWLSQENTKPNADQGGTHVA